MKKLTFAFIGAGALLTAACNSGNQDQVNNADMLSWAVESLIADGRGMSDTRQGVTLEVFGEGDSMRSRLRESLSSR